MLCERCGSYLTEDDILCPVCGAMMPHAGRGADMGVRAIRQGRQNAIPTYLPDETRGDVPEYGDFDMSPVPLTQDRGMRRKPAKSAPPPEAYGSRPAARRGVPVRGNARTRQVVSRHGKARPMNRLPINWMLIAVICAGLALVAAVGYMIYLNSSDSGQRMSARKRVLAANEAMVQLALSDDPTLETQRKELLKDWNDTPKQMYWLVGEEYMGLGDMEDAVMAFRIADALDPENYDGLMLLGNAYELSNMDDKAEALYINLMDKIAPSRPEAYTALIGIYLDQNRDPQAADMMLKAYTNTDRENFRQQRKEFIPNMPQVDTNHLSGRYELEQHITVTSPQGYDIFYTLDDKAILPEGGKRVEDNTVVIPEGTFTLRAVCVVENLVSDEMHASYTVFYPTPPAPKCNLAPNTYSSAHTVSLRAGEPTEDKAKRRKKSKEQLAMEDTQTFYYTIDGSIPDPEISPKYDGNPIKLPSGRVTLRAVAVNGYGKQSSTMEVGYKFDIKPYPLTMYEEADTFGGFEVMKTDLDAFTEKFGQPKATKDTTYLTVDAQAQHLEYPWGYAVFTLSGVKWTLVRVELNEGMTSMPRGVGLGSSESEITGAYKDYGMPPNQNGGRNLYYDDPRIGAVLSNDDGTRIVQYSMNTLESKTLVLQYVLKNGRCVQVINYYKP